MATLDDIRAIVAELPGAEASNRAIASWEVRRKPFVWECLPWPSAFDHVRDIVGRELCVEVKVADAMDARALQEMHPDVFIGPTTPWKGPKIAFRLDAIDRDLLTELVTEAWRVTAPKYLVREYDEAHSPLS